MKDISKQDLQGALYARDDTVAYALYKSALSSGYTVIMRKSPPV